MPPLKWVMLSICAVSVWMANTRQIAPIVGPAPIALGITEVINIGIFAGYAAPIVYLNGMLPFVADQNR